MNGRIYSDWHRIKICARCRFAACVCFAMLVCDITSFLVGLCNASDIVYNSMLCRYFFSSLDGYTKDFNFSARATHSHFNSANR